MNSEIAIQETSLRLTGALEKLSKKGDNADAADAAFEALTQFETLAGLVYRLRRTRQAGLEALLERAEDLLAQTAQSVLALEAKAVAPNAYDEWLASYRAIWRQERALFFLTAVVFFGTAVVGFGLAQRHPELVSVILPQHNMEAIIDKHAWFASLNDQPLLGGASIAINNIRACFLAFIGSGLLGLGGLLCLGYNGILIGTMFGFCAANGFETALGEFILGHGPLEITIMIAAAFAGLVFGRVFYQWPYTGFVRRMAKAASAAGTVLLGVLPWLIAAACVEAFISPRPDLPINVKVTIGTALAALFWVWTLRPQARSDTRKVA